MMVTLMGPFASAVMAGSASEISGAKVASWTQSIGFHTTAAVISFVLGVLALKYVYRKVLGRWPIEYRAGCPDELSIRQPWRNFGCRRRTMRAIVVSLWLLSYVWLVISMFLPGAMLRVVNATW